MNSGTVSFWKHLHKLHPGVEIDYKGADYGSSDHNKKNKDKKYLVPRSRCQAIWGFIKGHDTWGGCKSRVKNSRSDR